jgi:mono/diheme cytochrome c family protein
LIRYLFSNFVIQKTLGEKMLNHKTIVVLTFILAAGLVLAGCGTQATPELAATQAAPTQPAAASTPQEVPTETVEIAPTEGAAGAPAVTVSFTNDIVPIIQSRCVNCHGGDRVEKELLMRTYDEIMAGSENGPVILPGDPVNSKLVELVTNQKMPKRGPKLTPPQVQLITEWVAAGAPNN